MNTISGNLIDLAEQGMFDIIVHGCNCKNVMGAGIAKEIKRRYPEVYEADTYANKKGWNFLGNITELDYGDFVIINAYTQYDWRGKNNFNYNAIRGVMRKINKKFKGKSIGLPKIGAGLAGGNWDIISEIIDEELCDMKVTLVIYEKK